ncbi:replication-relaxation family protein [Spirillospora sp. NPDC127200]
MTRPSTPARRLRTDRRAKTRLSRDLLAELAHRLTDRDRQVIEAVWEYRVLTTDQLTAIFYPSINKAQHRLLELYRLAVLDRFRPWTPTGTLPWHWVLGPAGAHQLAGRRGQTTAALGYRHDKALAISTSSRLGHQVGVNDFFAHLHAYARHRADGTEVAEWWPEQRCAELWGDLARPDAFGRWTETTLPTAQKIPGAPGPAPDQQGIDFFLEHDTGTEPLKKVAAKLAGYAELAESTGITTPVLFWLPSTTREANLRRLLDAPEIPVATAVHTPAVPGRTPGHAGPAGAVWLPAGVTGPRRRLAALPDVWGGYRQPDTESDTDNGTGAC